MIFAGTIFGARRSYFGPVATRNSRSSRNATNLLKIKDRVVPDPEHAGAYE